jgi:ribonuclease HI
MNTKWKPPLHGWHTLNFDGVAKGNPSPANIVGNIKDPYGRLVTGYVGGIGI